MLVRLWQKTYLSNKYIHTYIHLLLSSGKDQLPEPTKIVDYSAKNLIAVYHVSTNPSITYFISIVRLCFRRLVSSSVVLPIDGTFITCLWRGHLLFFSQVGFVMNPLALLKLERDHFGLGSLRLFYTQIGLN